MAAARNSLTNYNLYFGSSSGAAEKVATTPIHDDLDESDINVWSSDEVVVIKSSSSDREGKKPTLPFIKIPSSRNKKKVSSSPPVSYGTSLPVEVPDYWSRILGHQEKEEEDNDNENWRWVPPHEYLARTRGSSFSVHEGIGRTLKGRDMSRVRNAVWKQIGFED